MTYEQLVRTANERLFIIGEAGVNHNGDLGLALKLVDAAKAAGCDAVKFQTWITEKVYSRTLSIKPDYQLATTDTAESEFDTIKKLELPQKAFEEIKRHCDRVGILFFSTPDEVESAEFLIRIGTSVMKTASQDVTNLPFLRFIARTGLPMIFSTGACTFEELKEAVAAIRSETERLVILHCLSAYPAPMSDLNLSFIPKLGELFGVPVGFSDHTTGTAAACAAVALGARVFEKHFTLDRAMPGPDHQASLDPGELADYVRTLREVRAALGDGVKRVMPSEASVRKAARRFLVAARPIGKGKVFDVGDFVFKKIGDGIPPRELERIVGKVAAADIAADLPLEWHHVEGGGR